MATSVNKKREIHAAPKKGSPVQVPLLDKLDNALAKRLTMIQWIGLAIGLILACLLFEINVSDGGDDSMYIENAYNFLHGGILPVYKGTLYALLLSGVIAVFGTSLIPMKIFSLLLVMGSLFFYFKAFRNRVAPTVLVCSYILVSVCSYYFYFASQTYSEALYLFLQALLIFLFLKYFVENEEKDLHLGQFLPRIAAVAFVAFLLYITRNIGLVAIVAMCVFFAVEKRWKTAGALLLAFVVIFILFSLLKKYYWGVEGSFGGSQFAEISYKNLYNKQLGHEDLVGYIHRFFVNSNNFFSKHLYMFMGFREEHTKPIALYTTITYLLLGLSVFLSVKQKNRTIFYLSLHVILLCAGTFIALQAQWDQWRQILVYYPYILLLFSFLLYEWLHRERMKQIQWVMPGIFFLVFCTTMNATLTKIPDSVDKLSNNLQGDMLYGMTPDWQNYINASKWAAKNLPENYKIAVRKPNISFVYTGRDFYGIFRLDGVPYEKIKSKLKPGYKSVILTMPDAANRRIYPDIAKYTLCVVAGNFEPTGYMPPPGTMVLYSMPADTLAKFETRFRAAQARWIPDAVTWLEQQPHQDKIFYFDPDALLATLVQNKARYFILASLRLNPMDKGVGIIDTLHKYYMVIECKYPGCIRMLHEEGNIEQAGICELNIPNAWK